MIRIDYHITPTVDGWQIGFQSESEPLVIHNKVYLTQPAAVHIALLMASDEMRHGNHARVLVDGEDDVLCDFKPKPSAIQVRE